MRGPLNLLPIGLCAALCALAIPGWVCADTQYVTDRLEIPIRSNETSRYRILKTVSSGTAVEVLGAAKNQLVHVRIPDGTVGYVLAEHLQLDPAARGRLAEMESKLAELQQQPDTLSARLAQMQAENADLKDRYATAERERQRLEQELATVRRASANVLDITNDRERLRIQVAELTRARADLEQSNRDLANQSSQRWFLIGSGVLGAGILLGLLLPRLRFGRRKSAWGSL